MSDFSDALALADASAFSVMGDDDQLIILTTNGPVPIEVIQEPPSSKNIFTQGGRYDSTTNVFVVYTSDLTNNGITSDDFICRWKGKEYRCVGMLVLLGTTSLTVEPNVNRRG